MKKINVSLTEAGVINKNSQDNVTITAERDLHYPDYVNVIILFAETSIHFLVAHKKLNDFIITLRGDKLPDLLTEYAFELNKEE